MKDKEITREDILALQHGVGGKEVREKGDRRVPEGHMMRRFS